MHLLVLVIGPDVDRQLALYGTQTKLSPYRHGVPQDEVQSVQAWLRKRPQPGVDPDDLHSVVGWIAGDNLAAEGAGHDGGGWYYWSTRNWKARWDYWSIGGSWDRALIARPGGAVVRPDAWCRRGSPDPGRAELWDRAAAGETARGAQALKGDVDFAAMRDEALRHAAQRWDDWQATQHTARPDSLLERQVGGFTRAQYLARGTWHPGSLVQDGIWHERGDLGLRADVSDERVAEWTAFVEELIERLPDETLLTCVDCHT